MQTYEFYTTVNEGIIVIPKEYKDKIDKARIKVILVDDEKSQKKDRRAAFGCLKGKINVPDDFNEPLDDFNCDFRKYDNYNCR